MEKKKLDRLFQEQFRDFEVSPPEQVWTDIEARLRKKKKRRVIPIWLWTSAAAILVIGLGVLLTWDSGQTGLPSSPSDGGIVVQDPAETAADSLDQADGIRSNQVIAEQSTEADVNLKNPIANDDESNPATLNDLRNQTANPSNANANQRPSNPKSGIRSHEGLVQSEEKQSGRKQSGRKQSEENQNREKTDQPRAAQNQGAEINLTPFKSREGIADRQKSGSEQNPTAPKTNNVSESGQLTQTETPKTDDTANRPLTINPVSELAVVQESKTESQPDSTAVATVEPNALEELLNEKENQITAKGQKINRWQITSSVAPIYFSSASDGSPLDPRFESSSKSYKPSVSFGVGAQYAINKRLSVRSGVNSVAFEYTTNDIVFFQTPDASPMANIKTNSQGSIIQIVPNQAALTLPARTLGKRTFEGVLNQRTSYIEVPVEMSYKLVDQKLGIDLIGGFSSLFLNENSISLESAAMNMDIGEAQNLNDVHFSTNVGVGFRYRFMRSFEASFEPMFKYQLNTYSNNSGNFKPYFFGLYTGLSYKF